MEHAETIAPLSNTSPERVFRLIYRSHSRIPAAEFDSELSHIFRGARAKNSALGISGALLIYDDWFAQTLEGPQAAVRDLFARIESDPRHETIETREQGWVEARVFSRWSMARVGEHGDRDIPLVASAGGVAAAAGPRSTLQQQHVLEIMRDATRGYGRGS